MKRISKTILAVLLFLLFFNLQAQDFIAHVKKIGLEDGLSSYNINCVYQDTEGFIWIATDNGINRFDGSEIKSYTKEENGLCHNYVSSVFEDRNNMLWIAAGDKGGDWHYCIFDKKKEKFFSPEEYLRKPLPFVASRTSAFPFKDVIVFCERKFFNGNDVAVYEYEGKEIKKVFDINGNDPRIMGKIQEGIMKEGDNRYVSFWRAPINEKSLLLTFDKSGTIVQTYHCDENHPIFLGTRVISNQHCVFCAGQNGDEWSLEFFFNKIRHQKFDIPAKAEWGERIAISDDKIYILNADSIRIYNKDGSLQSKLYLGLALKEIYFGLPYIDRDGNIWLHDQEYLICVSLEKKNFTVELAHPMQPARLRGIATNSDGQLLVGSIGFIQVNMGANRWQKIPSLSHNYLGMLQQGNTIWLGTEQYKLVRFDSRSLKVEEFTFEPNSKRAYSPLIWMPFISSDGSVWAGGNNGLYRLDPVKRNLVPFKDAGLDGVTVLAFHENKEGTWLCTSAGLILVDLKREKILKHFSKTKTGSSYIPAEYVVHLFEDKTGNFWLATKGSGLVRWNPRNGEYKQYTQKNSGLSHNLLYAVYGDEFNNLWISSQRGLMRFHKETESFNIYLKEAGIPHNEFNTISHYQGPDGHLYFGGQNGMVHFHPKYWEENDKKHSFLITEYSKQRHGSENLSLLTNELQNNPVITIRTDDRNVTIKFALLDYNNSQNHQYSYQIVGFDKGWSYQPENQIQLNGLPYGTFKLKLRAKSANASTWTDYPKTITIHVLKPFYLQIWFLLLMLGVLAIAVYAFVRRRLLYLEKRKEQLEGIVRERTQKIEHDKLLIEQQAAELRTLDELKSNFFSNISHELRTPLTLILGPLSYILDDPNAWEKDSVREQLLVMQRNGKNLLGLIEEILDLSKLEANKMELREEATPLVPFLENVSAVFQPEFQGQKLNFQIINEFKNKNLTVLMDRNKMVKVINNYLSNALKFTPKNGKIELRAWEESDIIKICVSDSGKGVHANDLPFIFERFYQSKQADQMQYGGTGIGLALVSDFAKLMGGKSYAESRVGQGSKFYFEFPKKEVNLADGVDFNISVENDDEDLIEQIGYDFTILVVEDNKDMRNFVCDLLRSRYKMVLTANNGTEGLQMLIERGADIQLIISDVMMPELDGLSMLREIKSSPQWAGIPVIMLTALAAERDKLSALTIGVDDYLTKPFSVNELLIRVQNLLYNYHQRLKAKSLPGIDDHFTDSIPGLESGFESVSEDCWVKEVAAAVKDSLHKKIYDVEGLAKAMNMSSRQLARKLNELTGLSPSRFIREVQLESALKELEDGTVLSIKEVCFHHGFEQPSTFSKLFKKRFGISPTEYLKNQ